MDHTGTGTTLSNMSRGRRGSRELLVTASASCSPTRDSSPRRTSVSVSPTPLTSSTGSGWSAGRGLVWALVAVLMLGVVSFFSSGALLASSRDESAMHFTCAPDTRDPMLMHLRTELGVSYKGDHWFHVAETFTTQHSRLGSEEKLSSSNVYLHVDRPGFIAQLNAVTKFLILLGVYNPRTAFLPRSAQFLHTSPGFVPWTSLRQGDGVRIPSARVLESLYVDMSLQSDVETRFSGGTGAGGHTGDVCFRYAGAVGGEWPTPQRGHWFPRGASDVASFRRTIEALCRPSATPQVKSTNSTSASAAARRSKYSLVIYQRDRSRRLVDEQDAIAKLRQALPDADSWSIQVMVHQPDRSPCSLALALRHTDVLLTAHGFQSMLLLLLPTPAVLFEVFPYRYFKRGYGPLSREYGVIHGGVMSPPVASGLFQRLLAMVPTRVCFALKQCRSYARGDDVRLTQHGAARLAALVSRHLSSLGKGSARAVLKISDA